MYIVGGLRSGDRLFKRRALSDLAIDHNRQSDRKLSNYGCMECGVASCGDI